MTELKYDTIADIIDVLLSDANILIENITNEEYREIITRLKIHLAIITKWIFNNYPK